MTKNRIIIVSLLTVMAISLMVMSISFHECVNLKSRYPSVWDAYSKFSIEEIEIGRGAGKLIWVPPPGGAPLIVPTDRDIKEVRILFKKED